MNLLRNECMKLFKKKSTWVMGALIVLLAVGVTALFALVVGPSPAAEEMEAAEAAYAEAEGITQTEEEHTLVPVIENAGLMSFVTMFTVIAAAGITAGEHAAGTIKLLLIRPVARWQILLSKLAAVFLFAAAATVLLFIVSFFAGILFYGWNMPSGHYIVSGMGDIAAHPVYSYAAGLYGLWFVELLLFAVIGFMIGTVFKSTSLGVGIPLVLLFTGSQAAFLIADYSWAGAVVFSHTDLVSRFMGSPGVLGVSIAVSIIVIALYAAVFLLISFWRFTVQDVLD
ncbi:MAG: hypothetical protein EA344_06220 [Alkalicoccus sp.]|nr:MAG: hypothetical protein EA344_06220 [Alkalicoccus sp.]